MDVKVPDIGDFKDVPVIEVHVKPGDTVKAEDSLITLESDKATMDVPSPAAGKVAALKLKVGDKVAEGTLILSLSTGAAAWTLAITGRVENLTPFSGGTYAVVIIPATTTGGTATRNLVAISSAGVITSTVAF